MDTAPHFRLQRGGQMIAQDQDEGAALDQIAERVHILAHYIETAAAVMQDSYTPRGERPYRKRYAPVFASLVIAQAILDSATAHSARLERIADTLDDLVEAIKRRTEVGGVW